MSIRAYLDGHNFDGETIRQMGIAVAMALASLGSTPGCDDPIRTALAQGIIAALTSSVTVLRTGVSTT